MMISCRHGLNLWGMFLALCWIFVSKNEGSSDGKRESSPALVTLGLTLTLTWLSNIQVTHYLSDTWVSSEPATSNLEQPVWLFPGEYRWSCCMLQTTGTTWWLTLGDSPFSTLFMGQMIILFLLLRDFIYFSLFVFLMGGGSMIAFVNYFKVTVSFVFSPVFVPDNVQINAVFF